MGSSGSTCFGDCDDSDSWTFPDAAFIDFPNQCATDADGDGYAALVFGGTDCNDYDAQMNPSQNDFFGDNLDQNCDGHDGVDNDGDNQASVGSGGQDCDDT